MVVIFGAVLSIDLRASLGVYYFFVVDSVCPSVTEKLQLILLFCLLMETSHFWSSVLHDHLYKTLLYMSDVYSESHFGPNVMTTNISGLVSADELRWFWISWRNYNISYGRGNQRGQNAIAWYIDLVPRSVELMKISSYGNGSSTWIMSAVYNASSVYEILYSRLLHTRFVTVSFLLVV